MEGEQQRFQLLTDEDIYYYINMYQKSHKVK